MAKLPSATTGYNKNQVSAGFEAQTQGKFWTDSRTEAENSVTVAFHAQAKSGDPTCSFGRLDGWKLKLNIKENNKWGAEANRQFHYCAWQNPTPDTWWQTYPRYEYDYTVPVQMGYALEPYSSFVWHYTSVQYLDIPAKVRFAPSAPSITISKSQTTYGEAVSLAWSRNDARTNMHFKEFRVFVTGSDGQRKSIYTGTGTSKTVTPSEYVEPQGGEVSFDVEAVYTWNNTEYKYEAKTSVKVLGGGCTIYDASGKAHHALIYVYDASSNPHLTLPTIYDASGKPHIAV